MFTSPNFSAPVCVSNFSDGNSRSEEREFLRKLSDLSLAGQVAGQKFFELFRDCVGSPDAVTEKFVSLGLLPREIRDVDGRNSRPLFPARGLEAALQTGKVRPGVLPGEQDLSPELRRPCIVWKSATLDYSVALFWIRSFNAARKAAEKANPKGPGGNSRPASKREREAELRAQAAEARLKEAQERAEAEAEKAFYFRNQLVAELIKLRSQSMSLPSLEREFAQTWKELCSMLDIPL